MDIQQYLARIRYYGGVKPSAEVLRALQEAHLLSVPFENLDILAGRRIVLDPDALFRKIVTTKRGGFCYELNGLFHLLLQALGFQARLAMGRVYDRDSGVYGPEFDHMLILAETGDQTWLVDVGFGDFSMHPLKLLLSQPLTDRNGQFLIEREDDEYLRVSRLSPALERYVPQYAFSTKERSLEDFSPMCLYHQTSPDSHFTQQRVCSLATATGRITLTNDKLVLTEHGVRTERAICDGLEFDRMLAQYFAIVL